MMYTVWERSRTGDSYELVAREYDFELARSIAVVSSKSRLKAVISGPNMVDFYFLGRHKTSAARPTQENK